MSGTVTIGCKLPNGLVLRIFRMEEEAEPVMGGGSRMRKVARQIGEAIEVKGYSKPFGEEPRAQIIGGYALTPGIDGDFWELWWNQNQSSAIVRNGLIFAHDRTEDTAAQAKEQKATWDGLAPLIPDVDRRIPKRIDRNGKLIPAIQKFDGKTEAA